MKIIDPPRFADIFKMLAPTKQRVQVYVITVDGLKLLCVGPIVHAPRNKHKTYVVDDIEFGEIITADDAIRLINGSYTTAQDVQ